MWIWRQIREFIIEIIRRIIDEYIERDEWRDIIYVYSHTRDISDCDRMWRGMQRDKQRVVEKHIGRSELIGGGRGDSGCVGSGLGTE